MAGVGGFFVKGLASGFLQGQQIQEMNWQRKEKERIKKEEDALMETLTMTGKKFSSYYADYNVSEDERLQAIATWAALSYEAKDLLKGAYDGVMNYNKEQEEQSIATVKAYREAIEGIDFDLSTIPEISDFFRGQIKSPDGLKYFDAADRMLQKNREALQPEVEKPSIGDYGTGLTYLKNIINVSPENWERSKKGLENKFGFDYSAITQESLREVGSEAYNLYATPEEVMASVKAPAGLTVIPTRDTKTGKYYGSFSKETVPTPKATPAPTTIENVREAILNAENIEDARRMHQNNINKYGDTSGIDDVDKYWTDGKVADLDDLVAVLNDITAGTPENRNVKGDKKFTYYIDGKVTEQTGAEWYVAVYESYNALIKILEEQGVDVSKYKLLKAPSEIKKGSAWTSWAVGSGVEAGDLIKIYY